MSVQGHREERRSLIVLGMHRSGTSALAGTLARSGVTFGQTCAAARDNPKGNHESRRIMALHDDILSRSGGRWDAPPHPARWEAVHRELRDAIIESHSNDPIWGFKDPRSLFTLQGWLQALPQAECVAIFRHPFLSAASLVRRNGMSTGGALELWLSYNRVLAWFLDHRAGIELLEFEREAYRFSAQLRLLSRRLDLPETDIEFFDPELRSDVVPEVTHDRLSMAALDLYARLQHHPSHAVYSSAT